MPVSDIRGLSERHAQGATFNRHRHLTRDKDNRKLILREGTVLRANSCFKGFALPESLNRHLD